MNKIAVFGTGIVAKTISEKLHSLDYEVMLGTRDVDATMNKPADKQGHSFAGWKNEHPGIQLGTFKEAANFGELIFNATSGGGALDAMNAAGTDAVGTKVVIDISNPLDFSNGFPPSLSVCNTDSLGEQIQRAFPDARVVKSLNTMTCYLMVNPSLLKGDHTVFMCGNDADAKNIVSSLLQQFGWKTNNIIDMGDITNARGTEMLLPIWVRLYGAFKDPMFNFNIVKQ